MPAPLPYPFRKTDIRLWESDVIFLEPYLRDRNSTVTDVVRDLLHRYANEKRKQLGLPPARPFPPGTLP